jgi:hypothetical protein
MQTFADLKAAIIAWANRLGDPAFEAAIPSFVALAEEQIAAQVRARCQVVRATEKVTDPYLPLPNDWLALLEVKDASNGRPLTLVSRLEDVVAVATRGGPMQSYSTVGNEVEILPHQAANANAEVTIAYYVRTTSLLEQDSNTLLKLHGSIYLFGCLVHAMIWLQDPERAQQYDAAFQQAVTAANGWQEASRFTGSRLSARGAGFS